MERLHRNRYKKYTIRSLFACIAVMSILLVMNKDVTDRAKIYAQAHSTGFVEELSFLDLISFQRHVWVGRTYETGYTTKKYHETYEVSLTGIKKVYGRPGATYR